MSTRKADGDAGARRAAAIISIALCAESTTATLNEDYAKVDLKFSFRDAFDKDVSLTQHCQVKSGNSYKNKVPGETFFKLNIDKDTINALSTSTGLIVWVPPIPSTRVYWYVFDPRSKIKNKIEIPYLQYVRPSIRYDLSRFMRYSRYYDKFPTLDIKEYTSEQQITLEAKESYKDLKNGIYTHPLVGRLHITRYAWRHITRRSKPNKQRVFSMRITPYLKYFVEKVPDRYVIDNQNLRQEGNKTIETRFILCWYRDALKISNKTFSLMFRIKEEIRYPTKWENYPLGTRDIDQKATLVSWWAKENK